MEGLVAVAAAAPAPTGSGGGGGGGGGGTQPASLAPPVDLMAGLLPTS
jgi:hypothetical protein